LGQRKRASRNHWAKTQKGSKSRLDKRRIISSAAGASKSALQPTSQWIVFAHVPLS
jgi:hypothetical protein